MAIPRGRLPRVLRSIRAPQNGDVRVNRWKRILAVYSTAVRSS